MLKSKQHDNDKLIEYLFKVFEMLKNPMLIKTDLKQLLKFFEFENIVQQEEEKLCVVP